MVTDEGVGVVVFLEIPPHPYLERWVEQCDGERISIPTQMALKNAGEVQFLENFGNFNRGFKNVDFNKFYASL